MSSDADCILVVKAAEVTANLASALYAAQKHKSALDEATAAQKEIAQQIQDRANALHDVWANHYLPCELATLKEVCNEPVKTTNHASIYADETAAVLRRFSLAAATELAARPNCVRLPCETSTAFALDIQRSQVWQANGAMRASEAKVVVQNAQRIANKINMVNVGRHGAATASGALEAAAKIYKNIADQATGAFNSALATAGRTLQDVPKLFDDFLNRPSVGEGIGTTENRDMMRRAEYEMDPEYYGRPASNPEMNNQQDITTVPTAQEAERIYGGGSNLYNTPEGY